MRAKDYIAYDINSKTYINVEEYTVGRNGVFKELVLEDGRIIKDKGFLDVILYQYITTDDDGRNLYSDDMITAMYTDNAYYEHKITGRLQLEDYNVVVSVETDDDSYNWEFSEEGDCVPFSECFDVKKIETF